MTDTARELVGIDPYTGREVWVVPGPRPSAAFLALARTGTNTRAAMDPNAPPITRSNRLRMGKNAAGEAVMQAVAVTEHDDMFRPAPGIRGIAHEFTDACGSAVLMANPEWSAAEVARRLAIAKSLHPIEPMAVEAAA